MKTSVKEQWTKKSLLSKKIYLNSWFVTRGQKEVSYILVPEVMIDDGVHKGPTKFHVFSVFGEQFKSLKVPSHNIFFSLKSGHIGWIDLWNDTGLQINLLKQKENIILRHFFVFFWPWNYVSVFLRGKGCIAPKLRSVKDEGCKTRRGKGWGI